jgi:hypothetical protein
MSAQLAKLGRRKKRPAAKRQRNSQKIILEGEEGSKKR